MDDPSLTAGIAGLLQRSGFASSPLRLTPCPVSGNNRVFRVAVAGATVVAKSYCDGGEGMRDRLDAEWRLLRYAAEAGLSCVPRALARDDRLRLALHSCCPGRRPRAEDIGAPQIIAAADFLRALNRHPATPAAAALPEAAEAALTPAAQYAVLERRLDRLAAISPADEIDARAADLVRRLDDAWRHLRRDLQAILGAAAEQPAPRRCISPSDFGYHNSLIDDDGTLSFIDFEYAGWDDPVKTLCDFCLQPAVPITRDQWDLFLQHFLADWPDGDRLAARAALMLPVFALKWCCIMLNPFVPGLAAPGRFSDPATGDSERRQRQLAKAEKAFESLSMSLKNGLC